MQAPPNLRQVHRRTFWHSFHHNDVTIELPVETHEMVVYNALGDESFTLSVACRSSGGLAQLGEHYVRNVGVGGSTPLPSTKSHIVRTPGYSWLYHNFANI